MSAPTPAMARVVQFVNRRPWLKTFVTKLNDYQSKNYRQLGLR